MTPEMLTSIGGLVAGVGGVISAFLLYRKTVALLEYRMREVEKKLDIHNGYAEKLGDIKTDIALIKNDMSYLKEEVEKR